MSHFYGEIKGARGTATRGGTKQSGMTAHIRGWNIGVAVYVVHADGMDTIAVYQTGGSNDPRIKGLIGTVHSTPTS